MIFCGAPKVQLGRRIGATDISDRALAFAIVHHLLDRFAEEAAGKMSLEVHVHPPLRDLERTHFEVSDEALEQAGKLGIGGEEEVRRLAQKAKPFAQPNLRHGRFVLVVENDVVVWVGLAGAQDRKSK